MATNSSLPPSPPPKHSRQISLGKHGFGIAAPKAATAEIQTERASDAQAFKKQRQDDLSNLSRIPASSPDIVQTSKEHKDMTAAMVATDWPVEWPEARANEVENARRPLEQDSTIETRNEEQRREFLEQNTPGHVEYYTPKTFAKRC
jgi:hypothetical protein